MRNTHNLTPQYLLAIGAVTGALLATAGSMPLPSSSESAPAAVVRVHVEDDASLAASISPSSDALPPLLVSQAQKLSQRLLREHGFTPSVDALAAALQERGRLLQGNLTIRIEPVSSDASVPPPTPENTVVTVQAHPAWLVLEATRSGAAYRIDPDAIAADLSLILPSLRAPVNGTVTSFGPHDTNDEVLSAQIDVRPSAGYEFEPHVVARSIADALEQGQTDVALALSWKGGAVMFTADDGQTTELTLLAEGKSNFKGSPAGRKTNIRNGLDDRFNGTLVPPGATVSFNDTIGPISYKRGWADALIIVNGVNLEKMVGGGLCQVATTVYRSLLLAGLPIEERKAHSLYVTYYKAYGLGLDATVMPGQQDLAFRNDTPSYVLFQTWTDGDDAFASIYGVDDGRTVSLEGPYFAATAPEGFTVPGRNGERSVAKNEIAWVHHITYADGSETSTKISSVYNKGIPTKTLLAEYPTPSIGTELLHTAAPKKVAVAE